MSLQYRNSQTYRTFETYQGNAPVPPIETTNYKDFQGVLNQLANTYGLGEDAAANAAWPGTVYGANTTYQSLVGALNEKNQTVGLGLNLVCCQLAGVTGLSATAALNDLAGNGPP